MGYDLHITRAEWWGESKEHPISFSEWQEIIKGDPQLQLVNAAERTMQNGMALSFENPGIAVCIIEDEDEEYPVYFDFINGRIVVKNPNDQMINKMKEIAEKLNASVIGDEGETY
jgi:signal recognition particle subunit SEC65